MQQNDTWLRFIDGDDSCFSVIYRDYVDVLYGYGMQFTTNGELVKDAIHDIFIRVYQRRAQVNRNIPPKFYLLKAMKNYLYSALHRSVVFARIDEDYLLNVLDGDAERRLLAGMEMEEKQAVVAGLLERLTARQREAIYYRYVEELSIKDVGVLMNMSEQSVQNIVQRSLKKMRTIIVPQFDYPELCNG